ncbi:Oryzain alpha chain [Capsicum chinense]|nr:Oryzain alpha chain [Capsicum chinense]
MFLGTRSDARRRLVKSKSASHRYIFRASDHLPESVDWRRKGAVAPIKDQGSCGSCWVFSIVTAVEGINQIATGEMITLSEQELVDCDKMYNDGCNSGLMDYAFQFIISNGGIDNETHYPYKGIDYNCDLVRKNAKVVNIDDYEDVPPNEKSLQKAVAHQPICVAMRQGFSALLLGNS